MRSCPPKPPLARTMSDTVIYEQCGLRMRSEVEVSLPVSQSEEFDIDVRWGDDVDTTMPFTDGNVIASYGEGDTAWYTVSEIDDGYIIRFRDCSEFRVSREVDDVTVHGDPNGRNELIPILLAGTVSAILLTLRGRMVLHASAVEVDGRVVAFVGQSGRGKSTMAALMCVNGARLVTDDVLAIETDDGVRCVGGAVEVRLREKAAEIASRGEGGSRETADDRLAYAPSVAEPVEYELAAIVIPEPSHDTDEVEIKAETPSDALFALLAFPRVHRWDRDDILAREFATISGLVNQIPVYRATIPWGPPFSDDIAPAVAAIL